MVFDQNLSAQIHDVMFHRDFNNYQHNFQCQQCNDWFETAQELNLHTSLAHKEKPVEKDATDKFADVSRYESYHRGTTTWSAPYHAPYFLIHNMRKNTRYLDR